MTEPRDLSSYHGIIMAGLFNGETYQQIARHIGTKTDVVRRYVDEMLMAAQVTKPTLQIQRPAVRYWRPWTSAEPGACEILMEVE